MHGQRKECHEAEEDERDLNQHDGDLSEQAHGAHRRRESERCVVVHEHQTNAQKYEAEPPARREPVDEGVRFRRNVVVVSGG